MRDIRLRIGVVKILLVAFKKLLRMSVEKAYADYLLRGIFIVHHIDSVSRAEIGDAALSRYACPAEKDDFAAALYHFVESFDFFVHKNQLELYFITINSDRKE